MLNRSTLTLFSVYVNFSAGAIAGVTELCLLFPLDTVKTRQQLSKGKQVGMVTMFKEIVAAEGCVLLLLS